MDHQQTFNSAADTFDQQFEPADSMFLKIFSEMRPDFAKPVSPWEKLNDEQSLIQLVSSQAIPCVEAEEEFGTHPLHSAEDWWHILLGSGYRAVLDILDNAEREQLKERLITQLNQENIKAIQANVVYGLARKASI